MSDDTPTVHEILRAEPLVRFRILRAEGEERRDGSWQRVTCHVHREDLPWGAVPLIYVIGALSFAGAWRRGRSEIDYEDKDEGTVADMASRLRFERSSLSFEADYVRGRMVKTDVTVGPDGRLIVETRNRHEMALRWLRTLKGQKHLRLVASAEERDR
jgi:hypothetical protein